MAYLLEATQRPLGKRASLGVPAPGTRDASRLGSLDFLPLSRLPRHRETFWHTAPLPLVGDSAPALAWGQQWARHFRSIGLPGRSARAVCQEEDVRPGRRCAQVCCGVSAPALGVVRPRVQVGSRVQCDALGEELLLRSLLGGSRGLVRGPDPFLGTLRLGLRGSQPPPCTAGTFPVPDSTEKLVFSGLVLRGPVEGRMLAPGQRQRRCQEPPWRERRGGALSHGPAAARWRGPRRKVGTVPNPVPVSPESSRLPAESPGREETPAGAGG